MPLRFIHLGDLHLGAKLERLPPDLAQLVRDSVREAVAHAFDAARRTRTELVLIPGDVYEKDGLDPAAQLRYLYEQAGAIAPVPVVIAPGNHDPYGVDTPYQSISAPANVQLFTTPELQTLSTPACAVVGRAFQLGETAAQMRWASAPGGDAPSVLMLHCSVMRVDDDRRHDRSVLPLTAEGIESAGYSYAALGHYHRHGTFSRGGKVFAAYSGCIQGQGWDELGPKGYITGELDPDGARIEFVSAAPHVWRSELLLLPAEHAGDASRRLEAELDNLLTRLNPTDLLSLRIEGRWPQSGRKELWDQLVALTPRVSHLRELSESGIEWIPELIPPQDSAAIAALLERFEPALGSDDPQLREAAELARYLGHRLLSGISLPGEIAG